MKQLLITLISIFTINLAFSQSLSIDLGSDKYICTTTSGIQPGSQIGENLIINNGTPPYQFTWETDFSISNFSYSASFFLNDTTVSNPLFIETAPSFSADFYLTVKDNTNQIATDTIKVTFTTYVFLPDNNPTYIIQGDSAEISVFFSGGVPPYKFEWTPNYNISNIFGASPTVSPDSSTLYFVTVADSIGCEFTQSKQVIVYSVNTNNILKENIKIYPNPTQDLLIIELAASQLKNIKMTDMSGKVVLQQLELSNNQVNISHLPLGVYILSVEDEAGNVGQFQVLKE